MREIGPFSLDHFLMSVNGPDHSELKTIFVSGLPQETNFDYIQTIFGGYGEIVNHSIAKKPHNVTALVEFRTHIEAENAIKECNYIKVNDQQIRVSWQSANPHQHKNDANLVISNLPVDIEDSQLHEYFQQYGEVLSCRIMRKKDRISTGTGYVQFARTEDADKALEQLQNATINGQNIYVDRFRPQDQRADIKVQLSPQALFVQSNDPESLNKEKITNTFKEFGNIEDVIIFDKEEKNKFAVVFFSTPDSSIKAVTEFSTRKDTPYRVEKRVAKPISGKILSTLESRKIFVPDLLTNNKDEIKKYFSQAGKIISLDIQYKQNIYVATIQYDSEESQKNAIVNLDRGIFPTQDLPLRVLPYHTRTPGQHNMAGAIMLNSLPYNITFQELRQEFSQYGNVVSVNIAPTPSLTLTGFVLFKTYQEAFQAKTNTTRQNVFLFPEIDFGYALSWFSTSNLFPNNFLVVNGITKTDHEIFAEYSQYGKFLSFDTVKVPENNTKTAFVRYNSPSDLVPLTRALQKQKASFLVLSANALFQTSMTLSKMQMPQQFSSRFLFGSKIDVSKGKTPDQIFADFSNSEAKVESVFQQYDLSAWRATGNIYVLFSDSQSAYNAQYNIFDTFKFLDDAYSNLYLQPFHNHSPTQNQQPLLSPPPQHPQTTTIRRPRVYLGDQIDKLRVSDAVKTALKAELQKLSVNKTYEYANDPAKWEQFIKDHTPV